MSRTLLTALKLVPRNHLSRATGALLSGPWPEAVHRTAIRAFVRAYGVNVEEAEQPVETYPTFQAFFTRRLRPGVRPVAPGEDVVVSPCDGRLGAWGTVAEGTLLQAKGRPYGLAAFLGGEEAAARFEGGTYVTVYLAPFDYHRVHVPLSGDVVEALHVPGTLWPVNPGSVDRIEDLFVVNERLVTFLETGRGPVAVAMVGATNVGRMRMRYDEGLVTNSGRDLGRRDYPEPPHLEKGDELGVFEMGSTVVLLLPPGFEPGALEAGRAVKMGEAIGRLGA